MHSYPLWWPLMIKAAADGTKENFLKLIQFRSAQVA